MFKIVYSKRRKFCFTSFCISVLEVRTIQRALCHFLLCLQGQHSTENGQYGCSILQCINRQGCLASPVLLQNIPKICIVQMFVYLRVVHVQGQYSCRRKVPVQERGRTDAVLSREQLPSLWKISRCPSVVCLSFPSSLYPSHKQCIEEVSSVLTTNVNILRCLCS